MINFDAAENVLNDLEFTDVYSNVQGRLTWNLKNKKII